MGKFKYKLFLHSEAGHPLPLNSIGTIFATNWSWHYELHEDVLGFMWVTLCANWQSFKLTMTTKIFPCLGGFAWETACVGLHPQLLNRFTPIFCNGIFYYKDSIPPKIMWFGMGGLLWILCGEKWGSLCG
jgi:hypothetical protein